MFNKISMIKKKQKENLKKQINQEDTHMVHVADNTDEAHPIVPPDLHILKNPEFINDIKSDFEKMVHRLYDDLMNNWKAWQDEYKNDYPYITNVDLLFCDNLKHVDEISKMYARFNRHKHKSHKEYFKGLNDYIGPFRTTVQESGNEIVENLMQRELYGFDQYDGPVQIVTVCIIPIMKLLFILHNNASYEEILDALLVLLKHEFGHVLDAWNKFYTLPLFECVNTILNENEETNKKTQEWFEQDPEKRVPFAIWYHSECPTEVNADKCVGITPEDMLKVDEFFDKTRESVSKHWHEIEKPMLDQLDKK